jgi:hypothetical protein
MAARDDDLLHAAITAKLAAIAAASATPPPWQAAFDRLGPDSSEEERLAVYRAVRDVGSVRDEAGFYLVSWQIDALTLRHTDEALRELEDRLEGSRQRHDKCGFPLLAL